MPSELRRFMRLLTATVTEAAIVPRLWRWRGWLLAWVIAGTLVASYGAKETLQARLASRGSDAVDAIARGVSACGEGRVLAFAGLVAFVVGMATSRRRVVDAAMVFGAAGIPCWLFVAALQFVFAESRPIEGGAMHWFALGGHGASGHAAGGALLVAPVRVWTAGAARWKRRAAIALAVTWAVLVAWSRVWLRMHYVWNVGLGLALGWMMAQAAVAVWKRQGS